MKQPWIHSATTDGLFILAPAWLISLAIFYFQAQLRVIETLPTWTWAILIIGIDVAHVYSTLFRTYFDDHEFNQRKNLYLLTPFICWVIGTLLYSIDALIFWRAITYFAVFHFVRQQYGLMMIYARSDKQNLVYKKIDQAVIYLATVYPLIYWHTHLPRNFEWFIENDFIAIPTLSINEIAFLVYLILLIVYIAKECQLFFKYRTINIPKNILLLGTAISWWTGIIAFNNDIIFTATNVIAHGIPYIALIWIYGHHHGQRLPQATLIAQLRFQKCFSKPMIPLFIASLGLLAYFEEGLWDGLIWIEHKTLFQFFQHLPTITDKATLAWLIPLLSLPQTTHYALDAFIWRFSAKETQWKETLFFKEK